MGKRWKRKEIEYIDYLFPEKKYERLVNGTEIQVSNINPREVLKSRSAFKANLLYEKVLSGIKFNVLLRNNHYNEVKNYNEVKTVGIHIANNDIPDRVVDYIFCISDNPNYLRSPETLDQDDRLIRETKLIMFVINRLIRKITNIVSNVCDFIYRNGLGRISLSHIEDIYNEYFNEVCLAMIDDYVINKIITEIIDCAMNIEIYQTSILDQKIDQLNGNRITIRVDSKDLYITIHD